MAIENFSWVVPGKLSGCALPGGRLQIVENYLVSDITELAQSGVACLVSLLPVPETFRKTVESCGLKWIGYPITDFGLPHDIVAFDKLIAEIVSLVRAGTPVCVHCRMGIGRTGLVLGCAVAALFDIGGAQAIRTVRTERTAIETQEQEQFVKAFAKRWKARAKQKT